MIVVKEANSGTLISQGPRDHRNGVGDCGLRIADCGLRIADTVDFGRAEVIVRVDPLATDTGYLDLLSIMPNAKDNK